MLMRSVVGLLLLSLTACHGLSANERKVVGTWEQRNMDGSSYHILRPDHSYAHVSDVSDSDVPRLMLACSGSWRIEGDDLITDCTMAYHPDSEKARHGPERHVDRERLSDFFLYRHRHAPISYDRLSPHLTMRSSERLAASSLHSK